jgi:transcription elongation GreA/GreB family factor
MTKLTSMTRQEYADLRAKLNTMRSKLLVEVPDDVMDYDAKSVALQRQTRSLENLLANALVWENATDAAVAKSGMVLTIRYDATGETETFLLGRRGSDKADLTVYSMASPLGRAIAGARPGDQRMYSIPHERGHLVTLLEAVPYPEHQRRQAARAHGFDQHSARVEGACAPTGLTA